MVLEDFMNTDRLNLCSGRCAKWGDLGFNERADRLIVSLVLVGLVVVDVGLALGIDLGFCFSILLVALDFRPRKLERVKHLGGLYP